MIDESQITLIQDNNSKEESLVNSLNKADDERFYKNILKNIETINYMTNWIELSQLLAIISLIIFSIMVIIRTIVPFTFYALLVIIALAVLWITVKYNLMLKLKSLFDSLKDQENSSNGSSNSNSSLSRLPLTNLQPKVSNFGTIISVICLNAVALNTIIFLLLLVLKIESINIKAVLLTIPFLLNCAVGTFYFIFILPGLLSKKLWSEIFLYINIIISTLITLISIGLNLDTDNKNFFLITSTMASIPLNLLIDTTLSYANFSDKYYFIFSVIGYTTSIVGLLLIGLIADKIIALSMAIPTSMMLVSIVLLTYDKVYSYIKKKMQEKDS